MSEPLAYSLSEFLKIACIGRTRAYQEINAGRLKVRKSGKRTIVLAQDARAWIEGLPDYRSRAAA